MSPIVRDILAANGQAPIPNLGEKAWKALSGFEKPSRVLSVISPPISVTASASQATVAAERSGGVMLPPG